MPKRKLSDKAQLAIRMTETLRRRIEAEAKKSGWSLNSELVRRLEKSFQDEQVADTIKLLNRIVNKLAEHVGRPDLAFDEQHDEQASKENCG